MNGQGNGAKAWEIIGYTYEGGAYCLPCGHYLDDSAGIICVSDEQDFTCEICGNAIA